VTLPQTKAEVRKFVAQRRSQLRLIDNPNRSGAIAERALALIADLPRPSRVALFVAFGNEPPTNALLDELIYRGYEIVMPKVIEENVVTWHLLNGFWERDYYQIDAPTSEPLIDGLASCSAVFVPAVALDADGARLGRGGGYYDRALANVSRERDGGPRRIGVVDQAGFVPVGLIPMAVHDQWMDAALVG
jgi:5-formyltetrahydrofolate cyclo-ligase